MAQFWQIWSHWVQQNNVYAIRVCRVRKIVSVSRQPLTLSLTFSLSLSLSLSKCVPVWEKRKQFLARLAIIFIKIVCVEQTCGCWSFSDDFWKVERWPKLNEFHSFWSKIGTLNFRNVVCFEVNVLSKKFNWANPAFFVYVRPIHNPTTNTV